jgi:hypothetical protein
MLHLLAAASLDADQVLHYPLHLGTNHTCHLLLSLKNAAPYLLMRLLSAVVEPMKLQSICNLVSEYMRIEDGFAKGASLLSLIRLDLVFLWGRVLPFDLLSLLVFWVIGIKGFICFVS